MTKTNGSTPNSLATLTAIGVKSTAVALLLNIFVKKAISKKNEDNITFLKETQKFSTIKALYYTAYWMVNGFVRYFIK